VKSPPPSAPGASSSFATTRWSIVSAAQGDACGEAGAALEVLCRAYWFPLYAFARRQGQAPPDAQDLTQAFFARLLEKDYLQAADRDKGRFRTFLLVAFKRFLANEWDKIQAKKRGGGVVLVPLDSTFAESKYAADPAEAQPPDRDYERRWAMTLLEQTLAELREEYAQSGRVSEFEQLKDYLTAERGAIPYPAAAEALQISEGGARSAVHRLRKRFRELFRGTVATTLANPGEIEDEVRHVVRALSWD
jgi:RNA polymerase sigma factor (sigma-70 family)